MDSQQRQDTKVQFHPSAKLRMFLAPNEQDRRASWYSPEDFLLFRKQRAYDIKLIRSLGIQQAEKQSISGIGIQSSLDANIRHVRELRRDSRLFQVLREQQRQYQQGICDPEAIAASCQNISFASSIEAQSEALRVQESSLEVHTEAILEQAMCLSNKLSGFTGRKRVISVAEQPPSIPMRNIKRSATAA